MRIVKFFNFTDGCDGRWTLAVRLTRFRAQCHRTRQFFREPGTVGSALIISLHGGTTFFNVHANHHAVRRIEMALTMFSILSCF